jgi:hypothetical protein
MERHAVGHQCRVAGKQHDDAGMVHQRAGMKMMVGWWVAQATGLYWPATRRTIGGWTAGRQVADHNGRVARSTQQRLAGCQHLADARTAPHSPRWTKPLAVIFGAAGFDSTRFIF